MNYIVSMHATQLNDGTLDALWDNESILEGHNTGSSVAEIQDADSIKDIWALLSHGLELTEKVADLTLNEALVNQYDLGEEATNTIAFISEELVLSITVIEVADV